MLPHRGRGHSESIWSPNSLKFGLRPAALNVMGRPLEPTVEGKWSYRCAMLRNPLLPRGIVWIKPASPSGNQARQPAAVAPMALSMARNSSQEVATGGISKCKSSGSLWLDWIAVSAGSALMPEP